MALLKIIDVLSGFPGWTTNFELFHRREFSRHGNGQTRVKDFGSPLWQASYASKSLSPNELDHWRAKLASLDDGLGIFSARAISRCRPILHPGDSELPVGELYAIGSDNKSLVVSGLDGISLSVGDHIQVGQYLHVIVEEAKAVGGITPFFEVRPHLVTGLALGDVVLIEKPSCLMSIVPGSVSTSGDPNSGRGAISWRAIEARG